MFQLHYKSRRFLCRVGFVLTCLVPTAGMLAWASWRGTAGYTEACRRNLEQVTGLSTRLASVSHPRPGVSILDGLELMDPRTRERLVYFPRLEWSSHQGKCVIIATGPELSEKLLTRLPDVTLQAWQGGSNLTLVATSVVLQSPVKEEKLRDLELRVLHTTAGAELKCQFLRERSPAQRPIRLQVVRSHEPTETTHVDVDTGESTLPCALAEPFCSYAAHWGREALFQGTLKVRHNSEGWHGVLRGALTRIDLAHAIARNFPHRVDGFADLAIENAEIGGGRLLEISGSIDAGPGLIGPSLRIAAAEALELTASSTALESVGLLEYEQLAFSFQLDATGLRLDGRCAQAADDAVLVDRRQMLLGQPRRQPQPVAGIVRAFAAPGTNWVPASHEAAWLLNLLPVER